MRVKQLKMRSFRGIGDLTLDFDETEPTVLIGINGVGKSSILDCLSLLLSRFMEWMGGKFPNEELRRFSEIDIFNNDTFTRLNILLSDNSYWEISRVRNGVSKDSMHEATSAAANAFWRHWQNEPDYNIPLAVYYPVNRAVLDVSLRFPPKINLNK